MLPITKKITKYNHRKDDTTNDIEYIVIHDTGNQNDSDEGNANYFSKDGRNASAHYFVDDNSITQIVEELKEVVNSFKDHQKDISNKLEEQNTKIEELNNKPAKALMSAFLYVLGGITTIFIGYALSKWGIK